MKRGGKRLRPIRKVEQGSEAWLKQKITIWFSKWIRKRDPFCYCGAPSEHASHFYHRSLSAVEFDEVNVIESCASCNLRHEYDRTAMTQTMYERFGEDVMADLDARAHDEIKLTYLELEVLAELYKPKERE